MLFKRYQSIQVITALIPIFIYHFRQSCTHENLGFNDDDDEDDDVSGSHSLFLDSACSTGSSSELVISSLREFTRQMEKVGLAVVEALTCAVGVRCPGLDDPDSVSTLMWVSENNCGDIGEKVVGSGRFYPYVVGLHYQIRSRSCSLLMDSGLVSVLPQVDSILITIGDIAQLLPVIVILLVSFLPSNEPVYSLLRSYSYDHRLVTQVFTLSAPGTSPVSHPHHLRSSRRAFDCIDFNSFCVSDITVCHMNFEYRLKRHVD